MIKILMLFLTSSICFGVNLQQTSRSNSLTFEKLEDSRTKFGHVVNDYDFIFTAGASYVDAPLVVKNEGNDSQLEEVIPHIVGLHLGLGFYIKPWLMIGAEATYNWFEDNQKRKLKGFSDPQIKLKVRLINKERWALSLIPFVDIGLEQGNFVTGQLASGSSLNNIELSPISDDGFGFGGIVSAEYVFDWVQMVANIGYKQSDDAFVDDSTGTRQIDYRQTLLTGIGAYIPVAGSFGANIEYHRRWSFPLFNNDQEQNELFIGAAAAVTKNFHAFAGAGFGNLFSDDDGNDYRVSLGVKYVGNLFADKRGKLKGIYVQDAQHNKTPVLTSSNGCRSKNLFGSVNQVVVRYKNNVPLVDSQNVSLLRVSDAIKSRMDDISEIVVEGHTSKTSTRKYNQMLSKTRANEVKKFLVTKGIDSAKITAIGFGESSPINLDDREDNKNSVAAAENRRVVIQVKLNDNFKRCE